MPLSRFQFDEMNADVIESKESNFPFIFVIFDVKKQIILLQKKTTIYQKIENCKNAIIKFIELYIQDLFFASTFCRKLQVKNTECCIMENP